MSSAVVVAGLLGLAGCGPAKLDVNHTLSIEPGEAKALDLKAQPKPQAVTVEYDSAAVEVTVGLFKAADVPDADMEAVPLTKALKGETGKKDGTFTADVPADTATRVVVRGANKKTDVKLHVTNRK
jgi:hypothetical protein